VAYFDKPDIDLENKRIVAVFTAYNEEERIPFFLSYYRRMGVDHFLAIDNNSADNSKALLTAQPDVTYFHTTESYVASAAGRLWTSELADHYCVGRWCLTLDLDEQLVFPGCESATLVDLCDYLDEHSYEGIFTVFLDMYSAGPLSDAVYSAGQPFLEVCDHFDVASYALRQPMYFPQVAVFGGPRQRIFWEEGKAGNGPSMRKMPLVRWRTGFKYLYSTHSSSPIRLADITGALLHFKFFSSFSSFAERELARGDRVQTADYENYVRLTKEQNVIFKNDASVKYESSVTLIDHGVAVCTRPYLNWLRPRLNERLGAAPARRYDNELRGATRSAWDRASLKLFQLPVIWALIGSRIEGGVIAILERTVVGWFIDRGGNERSEEIVARVDGEIVARGKLGHVLSEHATVEDEHRDAAFALTIPVMVFEDRSNARVTLGGIGDAVPFASFVMHRVPKVSESDEYQGECYLTQDRRIAGWAWRPKDPGRIVSVAVHIDGQFWRRVQANTFREQIRLRGIGDGAHGFALELPDWLEPGQPCVIHVTIHATNLQLRGSPLEIGKKKEGTIAAGETPKPVELAAATSEVEVQRQAEEKLTGKVLTARGGTVMGWLADPRDPDRALTVEILIDGRDRGAVVANAQLPLADPRPSPLSGHGFVIPVFQPWIPRPLGRGYRELSVRVQQTGEMLVDGLRVAGPNVPLAMSPYRGHLDANEDGVVRGWVWRPSDPDERVDVAVFIDGRLIKVAAARDLREDLWGHDIGDGRHAFEIPIPERFFDDVEHVIDVVVAKEGVALGNGPMISQGDVVRSRRQVRAALPVLSQLAARFGL
jgi:hypothetical protein